MMKKFIAILISVLLLTTMLTACLGNAPVSTPANNAEDNSNSTVTGEIPSEGGTSALDTEGYQVNKNLDLTEKVTLNVFGPGIFTVGEDGVTDLVSGIHKPGYNEIIARWNELYPNVTLQIENIAWQSWQSVITTACLSGEVDVIMHGATMTDLTENLTPYLEEDPDYLNKIYSTASRRTTENPGQYKVSGISLTLSPAVVWLDTEMFKNYGVDLPTPDWTYDDLLEIAEKLTGTDPVTGKQTYGLQMFAAGSSNVFFNHAHAANALGAKIFNYGETLEDCTVNYMADESIAAFQLIADMAEFASPESKEGVAVSDVLNGENNWAMLFREGPIGPYFDMKANGLEGRYVAISLPACTQGEYKGLPTPHAGDNNMAIFKDSENKEWAWEFIKFMTTDEIATQWVANTLYYPNNRDGIKYVKELIGTDLAETMDYCMKSLPDNYNNSTNDVFNNVSFGAVTNTLVTAVDNVINGYMTAEEAAQSMQDYVDEYLSSLQ